MLSQTRLLGWDWVSAGVAEVELVDSQVGTRLVHRLAGWLVGRLGRVSVHIMSHAHNLTDLVCGHQIPLSGVDSVVGRAFVIHEGTDDLGNGEPSRPELTVCRICG